MLRNPFKNMDMNRKKRSSNLFRQTQDAEKTINARLKIMVLVICSIFAVIIIRLVDLQLLNQSSYQQKLEEYTALKQSYSSPRGAILDKNGNVLVESVSSLTISYYPVDDISEKEEWELADKLVTDLKLTSTTITERQLKELHIQYKKVIEKDDSMSLLTEKQLEKYNSGKANLDQVFEWQVEATDVSQLDDHTKAVYQVKMRMDSIPDNQYKVIAEDVNEEQISYLSENSVSFPGFKATFDWKRNYSETGENLKAVLGSVSTQTQGIPSEEKEYYLALGYELNDRVGTSGLEKTYESYLSGTKSVYNIKFDEKGIAYLEQAQAGKSGYDITLTIDQEYQGKMDTLVMDTLKNFQSSSVNSRMSDLYLVAINPNTGEIISMSGATKDSSTGEFYSNPTGTYLSSFLVGSIVKPATLYMGLNEGVVTPGEVILDAPMNIKGTKTFQSYTNKGLIDDLEAIRQSSNVYMAHIAIRLGGSQYVAGQGLNIDMDTFSLMRTYYNMFGLGVKTGIDLPNEAVGYVGNDNEAGTILYYSIGQYDSFTAMQAAQYVATIANGGKKVQPHLLSKVTEVNDAATTIFKYTTNVISTLIGDTSLLERSKTGMELCVSSGSCQLSSSNIGVDMAAKTGTAEAVIRLEDGTYEDVSNSALIAYGPTENPEIAFACLAPAANNSNTNVCSQVVEAAAKEYFANYRNK